jgi:hypothetical protein
MNATLAVQGYFEAGRFVSSETAKIPERKHVIVLVPDEREHTSDNAEAWKRFLGAIKSIDEGDSVGFERATLHREVEI